MSETEFENETTVAVAELPTEKHDKPEKPPRKTGAWGTTKSS